ncbi:MAG: hypothetical protein ABH844_05280 [Candidatus Omnitrophota bacterium]
MRKIKGEIMTADNSTQKKSKVKKNLTPIIATVVGIIAIFAGVKFFLTQPEGKALEVQKGMGYVTWSADSYQTPNSDISLEKIKEVGCNWVSILMTWYQTNSWTADIQRTEKTPTDKSLVHAVRKAHELGMKVMLKLHLDLLDKSDGSWRGEIGFSKESDWDEWFRKYQEYIFHYLEIAEKEKIEMVCVGTELCASAAVKGYLWRDLIKKIRNNYSGQLTYAAHWDRYMDIRFWDLLDYVGINAYFPLTEKMVPTREELIQGWEKWTAEIEDFYKKVGKPIIFPEIGCSSADGAAIRPWEHVHKSEVNVHLQKDYYEALIKNFSHKKWFYGLYWWYWGTNINMGGQYNRGFTPQNKPAEQIIKEYNKAAR